MSVGRPTGGDALTMTGLYVRLLGCMTIGIPAGFVLYRWLHHAFEAQATVQETALAALALAVLVGVMRVAAHALARAP